MGPVAGSAALIGINGIHTHEGYLYWTNSNQVTLYKAKITEAGYLAPGAKAEVIVSTPDQMFMDDFAIDKRGTAWVCTNLGDTVLAVGQDGEEETVVGSITQLTVAGDTSARFGRTPGKFDTLYVSTAGRSALPVNGTVTEGGKVVAIDTRGFRI
jgi:sugar lactone lactonase YvrE